MRSRIFLDRCPTNNLAKAVEALEEELAERLAELAKDLLSVEVGRCKTCIRSRGTKFTALREKPYQCFPPRAGASDRSRIPL